MYCVECNKMMIFLYKHLGFLSPFACENKVEMQTLNKLMFSNFTRCLLSYRAFLWEVAGFFSLRLNASFSFFKLFFYFYYCLLGVLSNKCSGANFYDWCGILQKLLSAKLLNVISTKFLLMANPWRLDLTFKGSSKEMGPVRLNHVLGWLYRDRLLPWEEKWRCLTFHLPNYYFWGNLHLQFMNTFPDKTRTCCMFKARKYFRLHFGLNSKDNYTIILNLEQSGWKSL